MLSLKVCQKTVNTYVDPVVIKILNKARLFDQAKQVTTTKKKIAKEGAENNKAPSLKQMKEQESKRPRGRYCNNDLDSIADALLSRWEA